MVALIFLIACDKAKESSSPTTATDTTGTAPPPPKFVAVNYIEFNKIGRISKFRSSVGHDYHDDFEQCRSMKHYYEPKSTADWSAIKIYAPVDGNVSRIFEEWAGAQVQIQSRKLPQFFIIIFHVNLTVPLHVGDTLSAGQQIGTHIGPQTMSDVAVGTTADNKWRLISYFEVLEDSLFQQYQARGIARRSDLIITKEARDADTLRCAGDAFVGSGTIENWVVLK